MKAKPVTLPPVRPSAGIQRNYQAKIDRLIREMQADIRRVLLPDYDAADFAQDETPVATVTQALRTLSRKWLANFDLLSREMAIHFVQAIGQRSDFQLRNALRRGGMSVRFQLTPSQANIIEATVEENVSLIKSIAQQHLTEVEGLVMRSVVKGRDIGQLAKGLRQRYDITRRRAAFISRDQNAKATGALQANRQAELGLMALWLHSAGGKHPRPTHVANSGNEYDPAKGWYDPAVGEWILPGQLINCFPGNTCVGLESGVIALWRTPFDGPMVNIKIGADLIESTPNHPILTARGWLRADEIDRGDYVVCMAKQSRDVVHDGEHNRVTTFEELFEAGAREFGYVRRAGVGFDFHGQIPNSYVDEIIVINDGLGRDVEASVSKDLGQFIFPDAKTLGDSALFRGINEIAHAHLAGGSDILATQFRSVSLGSHNASIAARAHHSLPHEHVSDISGRMARTAQVGGNRGGSHAGLVERNDLIGMGAPVEEGMGLDAHRLELLAQLIGIAPNRSGSVFQLGTRFYELRRVEDKGVRDFSGHIYTMQSLSGHYSVGNAYAQAKNCRCVSRTIVFP